MVIIMPTLILLIFMDIIMTGLLGAEIAYTGSLAVVTTLDVSTVAIVTILWFWLATVTAFVWYIIR